MNDGGQNVAPTAPADENFASAVLRALEEQRLGAAGGRKDRGHGPRRTRSNYDNAFHFVEGRYPAAFREFVIPAEAGIQRARLDSPVSSTGQACQARNDSTE